MGRMNGLPERVTSEIEKIVVTDPVMKKDPDYEIPLADIKETRLEVEL